MTDFIYDIETYPNVFSVAIINAETEKEFIFEVSERRNDFTRLRGVLSQMRANGSRMVGFNNVGFDYPVLHQLLTLSPNASANTVIRTARRKADAIINSFGNDARFAHIVWPNDRYITQIDLYKIHHFDNPAKATSLKVLEFNMGARDVRDLPFDPNENLPPEHIDELLAYNMHDTRQTLAFYRHSLDMIKFREELSDEYDHDFLNHNDTKIGKDYFIMRLQQALGENVCYYYDPDTNKRVIRQTKRKQIRLADIISPVVEFIRPEFQAIKDWLSEQTITETKGVFTRIDKDSLGDLIKYANPKTVKGKIANLTCIVDGFEFVFGTGGLHGSIDAATVKSDDTHVIIDLDVTSYYPSLAIVNRIYPKHLTEAFCDIYETLKEQRVNYAKGTPQNAMLKLALNGVYGDSNNQYSPFYDPQYTMAITINGQLMLCMLAESLMQIPDLLMIQANTDGITVHLPREHLSLLQRYCIEWELTTGLQLESAAYQRMFIRDVNNYIAEYNDGKLKRKGAYEYKIGWHQNHSALVVQKAVEAALVQDADVDEYIHDHTNMMDFYMCAKAPRGSRLFIDNNGQRQQQQGTLRYYIANNNNRLIKVMPPLPKHVAEGKTDDRVFQLHQHYGITVANIINDDTVAPDLNYSYYIAEAHKMLEPLNRNYPRAVDYERK